MKLYIEKNKGKIDIKKKLKFIYEIALGIEYMYINKILHRDINSSNILLDEEFHCKICDFGMSKYLNEDNYTTNSQSTLLWMSPEYLCDGIINDKCDIYSFGILIWEIFMEDTNPYKNNNININDYILGNKNIVYNTRPIINDNYFQNCPLIKDLMLSMWNQNYKQRPNIHNILNNLEKINQQNPFL